MSRPARLVAALAALLLLTAGCAGAADPPSGTAPSGDTAFPVTLQHVFGETTIPERPQRVVALGVTDSDPLLAVGVVPVAVMPYSFYAETGVGPWAQDLLAGQDVTVLDPTSDVDVEQVAALEPDLVVAVSAGIDQAVYDRLSAFAPVLARPQGTVAYGVPRAEATRSIAAAVGETQRGEEAITRADAAMAAAREANPALQGATGTVLLPFSGVWGAYTPGDARGQLMAELGLRLPDAVAALDDGSRFYVELSSERLGVVDGDVVVVLSDASTRSVVDADPVLQGLPVVRDGGLVLPDADLRGAMSYGTVLSAPFVAERLAPQLAAAVAATTA